MESASAEQWRLVADGSLRLHAWEGENLVLVFQAASGDTHLLDALSAEVLRLLRQGPLEGDILWRRLLEQTELPSQDFPPDRLQSILSQLEQLELIERAPT